jgi:hypothetical protein
VDDLLLSEMFAAADFMDIGEYILLVAWEDRHAILTRQMRSTHFNKHPC